MRIATVTLGLLAVNLLALEPCKAEDMPTPSTELQRARQQFIDNFQRIRLNTTPGDAMMLRILVESSRAQRGVEVGTATGYGSMLMGLGFEHTGGKLITVDIDPQMVQKARANLEKMQLTGTVTVVEGDALKVLPALEGSFDFLFLDAVKSDYMKYFKAMEPKMKPGSVIVADNVIRSAKAMQDYLQYVQSDPRYHTVIIRASDEKGDGMAITYKVK